MMSPMHSQTQSPAHSRSHSASQSLAASHPPTPLRAPAHVVPRLPTAFHSNFLTSLIGVATFLLFWPPLPFLHKTGWEILEAPPSWGLMTIVAIGGSVYNAGLMILIGIWGPTTSSVANLLTIGVVAVFDAVWMGHIPDLQTIIGAVGIAAGFGLLLWEGEED